MSCDRKRRTPLNIAEVAGPQFRLHMCREIMEMVDSRTV